jgi:glycosidase
MNQYSTDWDAPAGHFITTWEVIIPPQPAGTMIRYGFSARQAGTGTWIEADNGKPFSLLIDNDPPPEWADQALIYQIFPDRFFPGKTRPWISTKSLNDFYGGTIRGIIDKLEYIQSHGFNTIWLNPFFTTTSHHGYNASDYYAVEPRLGTIEDLRELITTAHKLGLRLILDFVANHWSKDHFTFQDAQHNPHSQYRDWYFWKKWPDEYECYFNVRELPKINLDNSSARAYMLEVVRYWLREGFDGYRLDFAYGPSHDFWVDFRRACRETKPDCWIFGEVIHSPELLRSYTGIFDGTLDFYLARALRDTFAQGTMSLSEFEAFLAGHEAYFPGNHIRPSFLDNHDEERFLSLASENKSKLCLAALVQYSLSGPPIVYAGTETGLSQERHSFQNGRNVFEECRLPMNWETADQSLQEYYQKLNQIRKIHPVIWTGDRKVVHLDSALGTYAFSRANSRDIIVMAINNSPGYQVIIMENPGLSKPLDILNGNEITLEKNQMKIHLSPNTGAFICD